MPDDNKYSKIWEQLKNTQRCKIICHPNSVPTVKRGVIKEKYKDTGFKLLNEVENFFLKITVTKLTDQETKIEFVLTSKHGLAEVINNSGTRTDKDKNLLQVQRDKAAR